MNINEYVWLQLTEEGKEIATREGRPAREVEGIDGVVKWQLWDLMNVFGSHLYSGVTYQVFVKNEIYFKDPREEEKD